MKKEEMVEVFIPRKSRGDTERYVSVNGENMLIKTDTKVSVPRRFAEVVRQSIRQDKAAEQYAYDAASE